MVTMPLPVAVAQWVMLLAFGLLLILAYRQLAYLLEVSARASGREGGLKLGTAAPAFSFSAASGSLGEFSVDGGLPVVLMFVNPRCRSCEDAVVALGRIQNQDPRGVRCAVVTTADPNAVSSIGAFQGSQFEVLYVEARVSWDLYKVPATPFVYGIDNQGQVACKGSASQFADLYQLLEPVLGHKDELHVLEGAGTEGAR
jgi:hypothetical protein